MIPAPLGIASGSEAIANVVRAAQQGDRAAFERLYHYFHPVVHSVLLANTHRSNVDDLLQDVFATALTSLHTLREPAAVGAWLSTLARNAARMRWRSTRRLQPLDDRAAATDAQIDVQLDAERALHALRALPDVYRTPLMLRLVHGLTGPEIADRLGMTHGSVRVNLHRGMTLLRTALGAEDR